MGKPAFAFDKLDPPVVLGGKYRLLGFLGKGGMATVYRAVHVNTGGTVAVKIMHRRDREAVDTTGSEDEAKDLVRRFEREARLAGSVATQHIVRVHDAGLDEPTDSPYMVMELLNGEDLNALVRRVGPLRPDLALRVTAQACIGLSKAHGVGVVHRDIKPSNLFLAEAELGRITVKLLDFGIAKSTSLDLLDAQDSKTLTHTGMMLGSPHYMSPEQVMGARTVDARTDIWSLGIVLFKCLTARTPQDDRDTMGQIIVGLVSEDAPSVQNFAPWVSPEIAGVVRRALRRKPEDRFQTADEMLEAIQQLLPSGCDTTADMLVPMTDTERGSVRPRHSDVVAGIEGETVVAGPQSVTVPGIASDRPVRSLRRARAGLGLIGLVGALVVGSVVWRSAQPRAIEERAPSASSAPSSPAPDTVSRVTKAMVSIVPASASVEIDGSMVALEDGKATLSGELGSVHRVHVTEGGRDTTVEVIITEQGPRPDRVALVAPVASVASLRPPAPVASAPPLRAPAPRRETTTGAPVAPISPPMAHVPKVSPGPKGPVFEQKFE